MAEGVNDANDPGFMGGDAMPVGELGERDGWRGAKDANVGEVAFGAWEGRLRL